MPFNARIAQQVQNLIAGGVPVTEAYRIAGVSAAEQVYYAVNNQGAVVQTALPPPAQTQVATLRAEVIATEARIESLQQQLDNTTNRTTQARLQVQIQQQQRALADYQQNLQQAQAAVASQTTGDPGIPQPPLAAEPPIVPRPSQVIVFEEQVTEDEPDEFEPADVAVETDPNADLQAYLQEIGASDPDFVDPTREPAGVDPQTAAEIELQQAAAAFADQEAQSFAPQPVDSDAEQNADNFFPENIEYGPSPVGAEDPLAEAAAAFAEEDAQAFGGSEAQLTQREEEREAALTQILANSAQKQNTNQQRLNQQLQGDWRVRLSLLPGATYLYKDPSNSLLKPLAGSEGVVFPYMPTIQTNYQAKYDQVDLTHSNYRGYFYKSSSVDNIQINGTFTAQNTQEARYLLAVIHFFRSVTKMFYGQDRERGTPPPLVVLNGLGDYQFNDHPCVVNSFNYSLPNGVDYIRVDPSNQSLTIANRNQNQGQTGIAAIDAITNRLNTIFTANKNRLTRGAGTNTDLGYVASVVNSTKVTTYVPTKMEIALTLYPIQTRQQVSQKFSLKGFADGSLLRQGFW